MRECICSSCKNLKSKVDEEKDEVSYDCIHGYPSEKCEECQSQECEEVCEHYLSDELEDEYVLVKCRDCGKELKKAFRDESGEDVLCIECYLKN